MKKIGIVGCGWLGYRIATALCTRYSIYTTVSSFDKAAPLEAKGFHPTVISFAETNAPIPPWSVADELDVLIITVPLVGKQSLPDVIERRMNKLASFIGDYPGQLFFMSSIGVYTQASGEVAEDSLPSEQVPGELLITNKYPQTNILRLGGLMGDDRLLSKYPVANLDMAVNHIHYEDICAVIEKMIQEKSSSKLYNVVAPLHPGKAEVISAQKNLPLTETGPPTGRILSSFKMVSELRFTFSFPDPRTFHIPRI
ncbi:hypothetical protein V9K67_15895 [Paraflavisolibacter sp. H34]|uniref:hypothetical protein n=1 Tax=Huijunlia imazamoxiresistens TaxID=3127457 RepID=UPI00301AB293